MIELNMLLVFLNVFVLTIVLWLRDNKKKRFEKLKEKHRLDLIAYRAKLDAKLNRRKDK